jgi:hypothetical protein
MASAATRKWGRTKGGRLSLEILRAITALVDAIGPPTAPNGADHTPRLLLLLAHPGLQRLAQVSARLQPQRHHLHGFGPSTRPWIITKASI